ncbi:hypothetical protein H131_05349 [Lysinibacillus sphaericus OT4b.31]|uniref:Uncharacterized protein n=1 Tax=Lysinibacillus sphaericus OT4b.31 TaxID=1285586 RepID=R7ZJ05_LYSSH|nr:hypothetical protein H131_05349 [Lysinibacillus sphaericus OT4b.31]
MLIGVEGATLLQELHVRKIHFCGDFAAKISWSRACGKGAPGTEINGFLQCIQKEKRLVTNSIF